MNITLTIIGIVFLGAAATGGGLKAAGVEVPVLSSFRRQGVLAVVGGLALVVAFVAPRLGPTTSVPGQASPPSSTASLTDSPSPTPSQTPSPTSTPTLTPTRTLQGPWRISGSGVHINTESVTRLGDTLTVPVIITSANDVQGFGLSIFDQAGTPLQQAEGSSWIDPQARVTVRNILKIAIDPSSPPRKITLSMKGFFWPDSQRIIFTFPSP